MMISNITAPAAKQQEAEMLAANVNNNTKLTTAQKVKMRAPSEQKINEIAGEFEAQFISQMIGSMNQTVEEDAVLGGGDAEQTYKSFLGQEYGRIIARAGGIGVSDQVKREMLRMQEAGGR